MARAKVMRELRPSQFKAIGIHVEIAETREESDGG